MGQEGGELGIRAGPGLPAARDLVAGLLQGLPESLLLVGFQQIIHRADFEGANGVLIVGSSENDGGRSAIFQGFQHFESCESRHLHIQEEQIRPVLFDRFECSNAIGGFRHDLDIEFLGQEHSNTLARERFVIGYDRAQFHLPS
jgi:hypothetical protein